MFYDTPLRELKPKRYSITTLRTVLYGEIERDVDKVYCNERFESRAG